jgi:hypothetical protein
VRALAVQVDADRIDRRASFDPDFRCARGDSASGTGALGGPLLHGIRRRPHAAWDESAGWLRAELTGADRRCQQPSGSAPTPTSVERCATRLSLPPDPARQAFCQWAVPDSNRRPPACKFGAPAARTPPSASIDLNKGVGAVSARWLPAIIFRCCLLPA